MTTVTIDEVSPSKSLAVSNTTLNRTLMVLFTLGIFTSATLLFVVQPMVGKILLPKLGGAPNVWNTCMLFFQATLLAGYLTAHLLAKYCSLQMQVVGFVTILCLAIFSLPFAVGEEWIVSLLGGADPSVWLLSVLVTRVAPAFFALSVTSPLLQRWFAESGHPDGKDPYFLYSASNIGSILSLLLYPVLIEVVWGVQTQTEYWQMGFAAFMLIATICGIASWFGSERVENITSQAPETAEDCGVVTWKQRGLWLLLSAVPSSLMLGVTTYVSTDVSSMPMIWVVPLVLYLLTFVIAFSKREIVSSYWVGRISALLILTVTVTWVTGANDPPIVIVPMHLLMFFTATLFCHQRLVANRPHASHLTEFYLWMSIGGVVGGLFNALIAPNLFVSILEYPIAMLIASLLRESSPEETEQSKENQRAKTVMFGAIIFSLVGGLNIFATSSVGSWLVESLSSVLPLSIEQWTTLMCYGLPACLILHQLERRALFTTGLAAILALSVWHEATDPEVIARGRNFYGTILTAHSELSGGDTIRMSYGNTVHGWQWTDEDRRRVPLTYYGENSGIGKLIAAQQENRDSVRIGAIGLGGGTLAATLRPTDSMIYYEINPHVVEHAEEHFTYLSDARERGAVADVRLGDARLVLENELRSDNAGSYDILVIDAFSSDSIPVHLMTQECLQIYLGHLAEDGVLAFHITNRFLNLEPVLGRLAEKNDLAGKIYRHYPESGLATDGETGETVSFWVLLANDPADIGISQADETLQALEFDPESRPWTDDYTNILSVFQVRF